MYSLLKKLLDKECRGKIVIVENNHKFSIDDYENENDYWFSLLFRSFYSYINMYVLKSSLKQIMLIFFELLQNFHYQSFLNLLNII